jgi:mono/diheme cytochrome c family protein
MPGSLRYQAAAGFLAAAFFLVSGIPAHAGTAADAQDRGAYLAVAAGCITCHTEDREGAAEFSGGRALKTPFGTFYSPNITPDRLTGIGGWSDEQFLAALWEGVSPAGQHYFPAFPFTSYTGMTRTDVLAIKAYLSSVPAVQRPNRPHELTWYVNTRLAARAWQRMFFRPARFQPDTQHDDSWNRGAYLVRHLGHCGECHTPRNALGAMQASRELAGNPAGPEGKKVPDITATPGHGISDWSGADIESFLETGMLPDGDFAGAGMGEVVDRTTSQLTADDRRAIAAFLLSLRAANAGPP